VKLSEVSIVRPVLATVMSLTLLLFGVLSLMRLPVREYPDVESRIVSVTTIYRGASAQVVETEITPAINTGILHASAGTGQVGAGVGRAPIDCFREGLLALDAALR